MNMVTEVVVFQTVEGVDAEAFVAIVDQLEKEFHAHQEGFVDTELMAGQEAGHWCMIQHWKSEAFAHQASRQMFKEAVTEPFRRALDPKTVKMSFYKHVGKW